MDIKRWYGKAYYKLIPRGVIDMATISFERSIELSPKAVENLIRISNELVKNIERDTNAVKALKKGEEILKQLFSR